MYRKFYPFHCYGHGHCSDYALFMHAHRVSLAVVVRFGAIGHPLLGAQFQIYLFLSCVLLPLINLGTGAPIQPMHAFIFYSLHPAAGQEPYMYMY